ncbi:MAG: glycosyltransferase family 4 protein [Gemmatimonadota bacterium]|nr:glycosyltransferase family 4 protein [Gemmatimonadota bacterium]
MKIAVDAACLANGRGYGRFARELLQAMIAQSPGDEFVLFADRRAADTVDMTGVRVVVVEQNTSPTIAAAADGSRSPADMLRFTRAVWREHADVFFSPSVYTYFPLPLGLPAVVTVHDAIAERYPELTLPSWRARTFWRLKTRLALWQSRIVLTVSEFASREIQEVHGIPASRIRVAVEAPAAAYSPSESDDDVRGAAIAAGVPSGAAWFVYVGGFNPHKHLDVIVRAHAAITKGRANPPHLVLVGAIDTDVFHGTRATVLQDINAAGTTALVHWPGFVPDERLRHLLTGAVALLIPSENEGFGLPAVEAAACGTPVIATTASPLPELLPGGGFFVAPRDQAALECAMRTLLDDPVLRRDMGARARDGALRLSWATAARAALGALRDAAA